MECAVRLFSSENNFPISQMLSYDDNESKDRYNVE